MSEAPEKKIIVDEDWKEQAQREKEVLAAALEKEKEQPRRQLPEKASFVLLASSLATQAIMALGDLPGDLSADAKDPAAKKPEVHLDEARFHIDMLEMLEQKTKGNLTADEARLLQGVLFDLRMRYVEKSK